nr:unnamed protein product [Spirometra erinaceieuropaei]
MRRIPTTFPISQELNERLEVYMAAVSHISNRDTTTGTTPASPDSSNENQDYTCPPCDRTFTSRIVLVGHLRIHRTETGEPVPEAPTYTHRTRLNCPHCPRTFTHRMGLFGHMRIYESGIDHNSDTPTTPIMPSTTLAPSICATTNASSVTDSDTADFTCPHCPRTFASRIGLVGYLRIHRTESGEPVPGAPTYTHQSSSQLPTLSSHFQALHGPIRPHAHPRRPAVDNRRLHHTSTYTPYPPLPSPTHINTYPPHAPTAIFHTSGKCASRLGSHAASAVRVI